jgi:hypothetical protein
MTSVVEDKPVSYDKCLFSLFDLFPNIFTNKKEVVKQEQPIEEIGVEEVKEIIVAVEDVVVQEQIVIEEFKSKIDEIVKSLDEKVTIIEETYKINLENAQIPKEVFEPIGVDLV